jgi:hypothetical protein
MLPRLRCGVALVFALAVSAGASAQTRATSEAPAAPPTVLASIVHAEPAGETATFTFFNRPIVVLRARVLGRSPAERAAAADRVVDTIVGEGLTGPVQYRPFQGGAIISVGSKAVIALTAPDVDELSGETLDGVSSQTVERLKKAIDEAIEARTPGMLLRSAA